jgi:uncharacterized protein (DUF2235 family)
VQATTGPDGTGDGVSLDPAYAANPHAAHLEPAEEPAGTGGALGAGAQAADDSSADQARAHNASLAAEPSARPAADTRAIRKRLIVFSDGTGNSSAKLFKTNVWRLYEAVDLGPEPSTDPVTQIAFYDDGVGTSSFKPYAVMGGALGVGLARNVRAIYAFLCRHWAEGDEIYCFGFSRGAFTIRVLTGMIEAQGIITKFHDESDLQRKAAVAYRNFRRRFEPELLARYIVRLVRNARDGIIEARNGLFGYSSYPGPAPGTKLAKSQNPVARIHFVGLWDTVDAYGLPIDEMTRAWNRYIWPLSMRDRRPSSCIDRAVHLLSIDDERNTFHPLLWDERGMPMRASETGDVNTATISQVWFAGVHTNVGGGYPNDRLSYIPLMFMIDRIDRSRRNDGLRLDLNKVDEYAALADLDGPQHDSRKGFGGYYRYLPRRLDLLSLLRLQPGEKNKRFEEGTNPDIPMPLIHETVLQRIEHGSQGYAPIILPHTYAVVLRRSRQATEGQIRPQTQFTAIDHDAAGRAEKQKRLWNWVWLRRIVYFATVFVTGWLALMPFMDRIEATEGDDPTLASALSAIPEFIGNFLPGFAKPWIDVYRANPVKSTVLGLCAAFGLWLGGMLAGTIRDRAQHIWRDGGDRPGLWPDILDDFVLSVRTSPSYMVIFLWLKTTALPFLFAVMFGLIGLALVSQLAFAVKEMASSSCVATAKEGQVPFVNGRAGFDGGKPQIGFDPRRICWGSGIVLEGGRRYRLAVDARDDNKWADGWIPADLYGLNFDDLGWRKAPAEILMFLALPMRRYIMGRWFALYSRVSPTGQDVELLANSVRPPPRSRHDRLQAQFEFTAHRNGELFLYVNDAVPLLVLYDFYSNNQGTAKVGVEQLPWDSGPADPTPPRERP